MEFDTHKCLKLLKERKNLKKEGKFLWESDKAKSKELTRYLTLLDDQIFWESRKNYCQILDLFIRKKISVDEFCHQFYVLRGSNLKASRMWENNLEEEACGILTQSKKIDFQLNPESGGFTKIISNLHSWTNLYDPDITLEMNLKHPELIGYGISEEFLRFTIEEDFLPQLEKYCKQS